MRIAASALVAIVSACMLAACASSGAVPRAVRAQQNTAVVLAFLDTVFNKHEAAVVSTLTEKEQAQLARLLRKVLRNVEEL